MAKKKIDWKEKYKYQVKYEAAHQKPVTLKFHNELDKDILDYFETVPSKLELVRTAVREYMVNHK